jgi:hypothetical protein
MKQIFCLISLLFCTAAAFTAEGADTQHSMGTYGFESVIFGTPFDKANTYIQAKFAANDIITKTDSINKTRTILIEGYGLSGKNALIVDVILSFDRNDVFFKCELEGPDRISDSKLVASDVSYFLDMLKQKYGEKYRQETIGGQGFYRWSLGTAELSLTAIQSKEFQFAKVSISDVSLLKKQEDCAKAEEKTQRKNPGGIAEGTIVPEPLEPITRPSGSSCCRP